MVHDAVVLDVDVFEVVRPGVLVEPDNPRAVMPICISHPFWFQGTGTRGFYPHEAFILTNVAVFEHSRSVSVATAPTHPHSVEL